MSYNINTFKVKTIKDLRIPMKAFYPSDRKDWHPEIRTDLEDGTTTLQNCESKISGKVIDGVLHVSDIDCSGEGSGAVMHHNIEPALNDSSGVLIASCVQEGGDSINQLRVNNGEVEWVDIEIKAKELESKGRNMKSKLEIEERHLELTALHQAIQKLGSKLDKRLSLDSEIASLQEKLPDWWVDDETNGNLENVTDVYKYMAHLTYQLKMQQDELKEDRKELKSAS